MAALTWDQTGNRYYEAGVDHGVLYRMNNGVYEKGVAWNGLTAVNENPTGAEASPLYADNIKYLNLMSAEEFEATIEAYTYPEEFEDCDGSREIADGVYASQQTRVPFGLVYRTRIGNDTLGTDLGYKIHIIYGAQASPSEKNYETINDDPDAITFSWDITTTPVEITEVAGLKPTATLTIDSRTVDPAKLTLLNKSLFGSDPEGQAEGTEPTLLLPDDIIKLIG